MSETWPDLPLAAWSQAVGKVRMALTPLTNHWWNVTLHVTPRGLATTAIPHGTRSFDIAFDFIDHWLAIAVSDGRTEHLDMAPMAVADFYARLMERLQRLGIDVHIWTMPNEIANAVPFEQDRTNAHYDPVWAHRFWQVLLQSDRLLKAFRARFIGKVSPVHFFWGSFDLAMTRFSGRTAPPIGSAAQNVAVWVMQEACSHEVSSCGFWPDNGGYGTAAFCCYAYPEPAGFSDTQLRAAGAAYDRNLKPPYATLRRAADPDALRLAFLQETYEAAANLAKWDRQALERTAS